MEMMLVSGYPLNWLGGKTEFGKDFLVVALCLPSCWPIVQLLFVVLKAHRAAIYTSFALMITSQCHQCLGTSTQSCVLLMSFQYSCHSVSSIGWPKLQWFVTANLNRHPKDWQPPSNLDRSSPAYIEVSLKLMFCIIVVLVTIMGSLSTHDVDGSQNVI